jgi:serine/threonine-protein kinase SRPK3
MSRAFKKLFSLGQLTQHRHSSSSSLVRNHRYVAGGYYPVYLCDRFQNRYLILRKVGFGRYSTVWLARDERSHPLPLHCECSDTGRHEWFVALKILTADAITGDIHIDELRMLQKAGSADIQAPGHSRIVQLLDHFEHAGPHGTHLCLVLELLGPNLDDVQAFFMEQGKTIPWKVVKSLIK